MLIRFVKDFIRARRASSEAPPTVDAIYTAIRSGRLDHARALCDRLLRSKPDDGDALQLAGAVARQQGDQASAIAFLSRAAESLTNPQPSLGLGHILQEAGKFDEAIVYFRRSIDIDPQLYDARLAIAKALLRAGRSADAETHLSRAIALRPDDFEAHQLLTRVLYAQARHRELAGTVRTMQRIKPFDGGDIFVALLIPAVNQSAQEIAQAREDLTRRISDLLEGPPLSVTNPDTEIGITPFYLAYHGLNDCELQKQIVRLCRKAYRPARSEPIALQRHRHRIRVGFVSEHFNFHSVGRMNHGFISGLRREQFEVTVFSLARHDDPLARRIRTASDHYVEFHDQPLARIEAAIAEQQMDVLFYTDVGMDPLTYFLAYSRLAPVQCVGWGHPDTTGIDTLDYFISADVVEVPEADDFYSEKLIRLPTSIVSDYERPRCPTPMKARAAYGLNDAAHIYACPQAQFKIHPDFDQAIAGILRNDARGEVVFVGTRHRRLDELLQMRFARTIPDVLQRVRFLPHMDYQDYLNLIAISDVMLDPFHFGGGNTTYESLAMGVPVVTLPSQFLRGRPALGCYVKMQMTECVAHNAQHYADIAVRLGREADYRKTVVTKISERSDVLFNNHEIVEALGRFLEETCDSA